MLGFSIAAAVAAGASSALAVPLTFTRVEVPSGPAVVQSYTTSAGSTFEYQSCNSDLAYGNRALPNLLTTTSKTVESCLDACASKGYKLCGVEYHGECWGGNTLHETSKVEDESACNFTCWDNDKEICGGSGASTNAAMNLYAVNAASLANVAPTGPFVLQNRTTSAGTYKSQGCYSDLAYGNRALPNMLVTTTKTAEACLDLCAKSNYAYCGVEYHGECWGGNALHDTSKAVKASACDFTCWDNSNQVCGGSGAGTEFNAAMNLYTLDAPAVTPPGQNNQTSTNPTTPVQQPSTGPFVLQHHTASTGLAYDYDACYSDLAYGTRALPNMLVTASKTAEACLELCAQKNYKYCGVEYHGECWGGNTLDSTSTKQDEKACGLTCWDNANQICGGQGGSTGAAMNLYTVNEDSASTATPTGPFVLKNRTTSAGVYNYDACYSDLAEGTRALPNMLVTTTKTAEACLDLCAKSNYTLCGVEYHGECWGGNSLDKTSTKQKESACDLTCWDSPNQVCGGTSGPTGAAMNLYRLQTAQPCSGFLVNGECRESCGAGFFQNNNDRTCTKCTVNGAASCDTSANVASSCSTGFLKDGQCASSCGDGYFQDTTTKVCTMCTAQGAATCTTAPNVASSCSQGVLVDGQCREGCGDGYFFDSANNSCIKCTAFGAATCTTAADVATSCKVGFLLNGRCQEGCGNGYFAANNRCYACVDSDAATCPTSAFVATSCKTKYLSNGSCVSSCPDNQFAQQSPRECVPVAACSSAQYLDTATNTCKSCSSKFSNSATCSSSAALTCADGYVLKAGACEKIASCSSSEYLDTATNTCKACSTKFSNSATCSSSAPLTCASGYALDNAKTACVVSAPSCGTGRYLDPATNSCNPCVGKFAWSLACTAEKATACQPYAFVENGVCALNCRNPGYVYNNGRDFVPGSKARPLGTYTTCETCPDPWAVTCDPFTGKTTSCVNEVYPTLSPWKNKRCTIY